MRFVGTDFVGTLVGTTPENGLKMGYFGSFFGNFIQVQRHEKCPRCLIFTHLGHFTKAEREGFEPSRRYQRLHDFQSCAFDQLSHLSIWFTVYARPIGQEKKWCE